MSTASMIKANEMPAPDTLVDYGVGGVMCAMLHYVETDTPFVGIIREHGYEAKFETFGDAEPEDHPLFTEFENGENIVDRWRPEPPAGWQLGGVYDTEDGPCALFIRQIQP
ncbi:hypothetical protein APY04_0778 [Hyphomicrobium sulfonivorans]|uniref:Uncharacterized protein n=1 Tax=Hyphomicrobium sulfonivorans TaxID=121290 RepID=A0A109BKX3_HYPSL|nr:hypothetical protein [Hyphomicrobium sulfonivorans]KWT70717.1 hypothetical protein APY04_0778 [Hyphomicrobium sulfonivorans]